MSKSPVKKESPHAGVAQSLIKRRPEFSRVRLFSSELSVRSEPRPESEVLPALNITAVYPFRKLGQVFVMCVVKLYSMPSEGVYAFVSHTFGFELDLLGLGSVRDKRDAIEYVVNKRVWPSFRSLLSQTNEHAELNLAALPDEVSEIHHHNVKQISRVR